MCIKIPTFAVYKHSAITNLDLTYVETDDCPTKDCENLREQTEYRKEMF